MMDKSPNDSVFTSPDGALGTAVAVTPAFFFFFVLATVALPFVAAGFACFALGFALGFVAALATACCVRFDCSTRGFFAVCRAGGATVCGGVVDGGADGAAHAGTGAAAGTASNTEEGAGDVRCLFLGLRVTGAGMESASSANTDTAVPPK